MGVQSQLLLTGVEKSRLSWDSSASAALPPGSPGGLRGQGTESTGEHTPACVRAQRLLLRESIGNTLLAPREPPSWELSDGDTERL